ncbi:MULTISPECIES: hypothetical protein [Pseudomonas]|jgi:hypothetical protein|uniref:hypothetical protein n=1 Tax=Pseudomonas TaxID=286 RepID=UPI001AE6AC32|nr:MULTISPECIES: hypothetical protein [unclassified Pseudomonas]MBP1125736.1 hypothetical protein [Pseudomonas sp. PvP025]MDQ0399596.1 hypothetical protein [Pseudomonas sp. PvP006]
MLIIPLPRFNEQNSAPTPAELNTQLITGHSAGLTADFPVEKDDRVFLTLSSTVRGGEFNQSFQIAQSAPKLEFLIPKSFVEVSAGTLVHLLLSINRARLLSAAPTARVFINPLPIIVPPPATVWDFSDNTLQGWVPQGPYVGGLLHVINSSVVVDLLISQPVSAHIITRAVPVTAGRTYDFSFDVIGGSAVSDGSALCMTMNGSRIGADVKNITQAQPQTGTGSFTATATTSVRLGIFNQTVPRGAHRLSLSNIRMTLRP